MKTFKVASEEGAQRYGAEVGDHVDLTLEEEEKVAVIAAGWLEDTPKKQQPKEEK
jgi:hypothetical protein